jgi:hypothetical protein
VTVSAIVIPDRIAEKRKSVPPAPRVMTTRLSEAILMWAAVYRMKGRSAGNTSVARETLTGGTKRGEKVKQPKPGRRAVNIR